LARPLVTIGLTAYNASDRVERAVNSALAQTWRPIEIVAVDDGSNDGTRAILDYLAAQHPELRVFCNAANAGVAVSRNRILAEARGEFVAFFDDDDESLPQRVATQLTRILEYERGYAAGAPVVCHTARLRIYSEALQRTEPTMGETEGQRAPAGPAVAQRILLGTPLRDAYGACPTCSQMARLSTYRDLGGFDPTLRRGEDTDFSIRLAEAGGHFIGLAQPLVIQRMRKTSEKSLAEEYRNLVLLMEKHRPIMDRLGQYGFCRRWMQVKQAWLEGRRPTFLLILFSLLVTHPFLTCRRLALALPNFRLNKAFRRFHRWQ
jgi:glycosyltransferase involved in cell wall biosynthesis